MTTAAGTRLDELLDQLRAQYGHLRVQQTHLNLKHCFHIREKGRGKWRLPHIFQNQETILAYVLLGPAPAIPIQKIMTDSHGTPIRCNGKYELAPYSPPMQALACVSIKPLQNFALQEVSGIMRTNPATSNIHGFSRTVVLNIENAVGRAYKTYNPERDNVFLFAGSKLSVLPRLKLSAAWLQQALMLGSKTTDRVSPYEAGLMEDCLMPQVRNGNHRAIEEASYHFGQPNHVPQTVEFLQRKVAAYQRMMKTQYCIGQSYKLP